jgi:hypothetical protein
MMVSGPAKQGARAHEKHELWRLTADGDVEENLGRTSRDGVVGCYIRQETLVQCSEYRNIDELLHCKK